MFQKTSATPKFKNPFSRTPKTPDTPDTPETPDPKKVKETDPFKSGAQAAAAAAGTGLVINKFQSLGDSKNAADRLVGKVLDMSQEQGKNADRLAVELGEREVLISQLLTSMPEDLLAKYFDEFLFKKDIPWTATREFMQKAVNAEQQGAEAEDVLDFALVFYDKRRNFGNTITIIDMALDLQPQMRNVNIFKAMKGSLQGTREAAISFLLIGPENIDKTIVLNKLLGMVLARGAEDLEVLRREFQLSKDQLQRKREVADRFRGIYDAMMSMEFQSALKRNVQFVTEQFALSVNDPQIQSFARILYDIKLGQEFRSEIFASLEGRQTAETTPGLAEQSRVTQRRSSSKNSRFVVAQEAPKKAKTVNPVFLTNFSKYLAELIKVAEVLKVRIAKATGDDIQIANEIKGLVTTASDSLKNAQNKISVVDFSTIFAFYLEALNKFEAVNVVLKQNPEKTASNQTNAMSFRFAQNPIQNPPGVAVNVTGPTSGAGGGNGEFLSDEAQKIADTVFKGAAGVTGVIALATGDFKSALAAGTALFLQQKNKNALAIANTAGIEPPRDLTPQYVLDDAAEALKALGANLQQQQEFVANDQFIKQVSSTINVMERSLLLVIDAQVKTADGSIETPLESPEKVDKLYRDFMAYLRQANDYCSRQIDLVNTLAQNTNNPTVQQKLGSIRQYQAMVQSSVEEIRSKISEYASITEIISNVQSQKFLLLKIKELIPQLDKYLATGLSVADVLGSEGGVLGKIKDYIDFERDSYNKLYKKWSELIAKFPNLRYDNVTSPERPPVQQTANVPSSVAPNPTQTVSEGVNVDQSGNMSEGGDIQGYQRSASVQFSNLMFEKKVVTSATDPGQQAKYNYYITKMNQPGMNFQNLVRALDGDMTFVDANLKLLARNAILAKSVPPMVQSLIPQYEGSVSDAQGRNVSPETLQTQQAAQATQPVGQTATQATQAAPAPQAGAGVGSTVPGRQLSSDAEVDRFKDLKNVYKEFEKQFGNYGVMPSANTVEYDPKRMIASMRVQLQKVFENIQVMEKIYYQLLQNPQDFGGIIPALKRASTKFVKVSGFKKVEESKEVKEADEYLEDYYNNEMDYAPYGTALEHPQENRNKITDEIKVHSTSKFKKI